MSSGRHRQHDDDRCRPGGGNKHRDTRSNVTGKPDASTFSADGRIFWAQGNQEGYPAIKSRDCNGIAAKRSDAEFELVDIKHYNLPLLDEPVPPIMGQYSQAHTKLWAAKINSFDSFVFVTPEYNHGTSGALKNAIDFLYKEWNNKAAGFVSYGSAGGARAVEQLRLIMAELQVATVRAQVMFSLYTDFENFSTFKPGSHQEAAVNNMLNQVIAWGGAMKTMRNR